MKVNVVRVTGEGEQMHFEVNVPAKQIEAGPLAVHEYLKRAIYEPADIRLSESSRRLLDAMGFAKNLPPEGQIAVKHVIDLIYGRAQSLAPVPQEVIDADRQAQKVELEKLHDAGVEIEPREAEKVVVGPWPGSGEDADDEEPA